MATCSKQKLLIAKIILTFSLLIPLASFAQVNDKIPPPPARPQGVDSLVGGYGAFSDRLLYAKPSYSLFPADGLSQNLYINTPTLPRVTIDTQILLSKIIRNPQIIETPNQLLNYIVAFTPGNVSDTSIKTELLQVVQNAPAMMAATGCQGPQCLIYSQFKKVDINSLIGPLTFDKSSEQTAKKFIENTIGADNTLEIPDFPSIAKASDNQSITSLVNENKTYLASLRLYTAIQSAALSNFMQLHAERKPIDPPKDPNMVAALNQLGFSTASPSNMPSPLALENMMATRRITDLNWYKSLYSDTPAALQRQMLVLLAQNLAETYQMRMTLERVLATQTLQLLQQNILLRQELELRAKEVGSKTPSAR